MIYRTWRGTWTGQNTHAYIRVKWIKSSDRGMYEPLCEKGLAQCWITRASRSSMFFEIEIPARWKSKDRRRWKEAGGAISLERRFLSDGRALTLLDILESPVPEGRKDYLETRKRSPPYLRRSSCDEPQPPKSRCSSLPAEISKLFTYDPTAA